MKKKYVQPKMKMVKVIRRSPLLGSSNGWDSDYTSGFNDTPGGQENFQ